MSRLKFPSALARIKCRITIYMLDHVIAGSDAASVLAHREIGMLQESVAIGARRTGFRYRLPRSRMTRAWTRSGHFGRTCGSSHSSGLREYEAANSDQLRACPLIRFVAGIETRQFSPEAANSTATLALRERSIMSSNTTWPNPL